MKGARQDACSRRLLMNSHLAERLAVLDDVLDADRGEAVADRAGRLRAGGGGVRRALGNAENPSRLNAAARPAGSGEPHGAGHGRDRAEGRRRISKNNLDSAAAPTSSAARMPLPGAAMERAVLTSSSLYLPGAALPRGEVIVACAILLL